MTIRVRPETPADFAAIRAINRDAFGVFVEADLVERLRADGDLLLSLVAGMDGMLIGYCGFSRLTVRESNRAAVAVALGPVAVLPAAQRQGVGQALIRDGIARLGSAGETLMLVLGDPKYYARYGFDAKAARAYRTPYDGPYLQALRLSDDAPLGGEVRYASAFAGL